MTQLTIDISEQDYAALQAEARQRGETLDKVVRKYLSIARVLAQDNSLEKQNQWPEDYFELFGAWQGTALQRPEQGKFEQHLEFK